MKNIFLFITMLFLTSCATKPTKFKYLSVGMQKSEVINILGEPISVSAKDGLEYLIYEYNVNPITGVAGYYGGPDRHFVRLKDGRVDAFGRVGDFDSTKMNEATVNLNVQQK